MPEENKTATEKKPYRLALAYWDNRLRHAAGSILYFEEGKEPKGSTLVKEEEDEALDEDEDLADKAKGPKTATKA